MNRLIAPSKIIKSIGRRQILRGFASFVPVLGVRKLFGAIPAKLLQSSPVQTPPRNLFDLVNPSASGINWVHSNRRSPDYHLPETTGAGCAFLDYHNDRWMDIYLVNSGKCDFFDPKPALRNALYRNNRDGTFADVTEK